MAFSCEFTSATQMLPNKMEKQQNRGQKFLKVALQNEFV